MGWVVADRIEPIGVLSRHGHNGAYEAEHAPALEILLKKENATDWSHFELKLCLPVRKAAEMRG